MRQGEPGLIMAHVFALLWSLVSCLLSLFPFCSEGVPCRLPLVSLRTRLSALTIPHLVGKYSAW